MESTFATQSIESKSKHHPWLKSLDPRIKNLITKCWWESIYTVDNRNLCRTPFIKQGNQWTDFRHSPESLQYHDLPFDNHSSLLFSGKNQVKENNCFSKSAKILDNFECPTKIEGGTAEHTCQLRKCYSLFANLFSIFRFELGNDL